MTTWADWDFEVRAKLEGKSCIGGDGQRARLAIRDKRAAMTTFQSQTSENTLTAGTGKWMVIVLVEPIYSGTNTI